MIAALTHCFYTHCQRPNKTAETHLYSCSRISRALSIDNDDRAGLCTLLLVLLGAAGPLALKDPCRCCWSCCCSCCCSCWCCCPSSRWGFSSCMRLSSSSGQSSGGCKGTKEGKRAKAAFCTGGKVPAFHLCICLFCIFLNFAQYIKSGTVDGDSCNRFCSAPWSDLYSY